MYVAQPTRATVLQTVASVDFTCLHGGLFVHRIWFFCFTNNDRIFERTVVDAKVDVEWIIIWYKDNL